MTQQINTALLVARILMSLLFIMAGIGKLGNVEGFALRCAVSDVEEDDVPQFLKACKMCERAADLSRADKGDFRSGHWKSLRVG